jgi:YrhK-like protein
VCGRQAGAPAPPARWGRDWWAGALFMAGSFCFALGSAPGLSAAIPSAVIGGVFFVGSLLFTSAAGLQLVSSMRARAAGADLGDAEVRAAAFQLVGTVWFNVNTFAALQTGLTIREQDLRVWTPDMIGSVCFLVSSWLALTTVRRGSWWRPGGSVGWVSARLNMVGSVFFMAAAIAAFVRPATGDPVAAAVANGGTFLGALCFFRGARLPLARAAERPGRSRQEVERASNNEVAHERGTEDHG